MQKTTVGRREAMTNAVRKALSNAGAVEFGEIVSRYGRQGNATCGFTVQPTSGVTAIVTFRGPPLESRAIGSFLVSYAKTLADAGFWADANCTAGYVAVEVLAGPATAR